MSKWLEFIEKESKPKTKVYSVYSKCGDCELGEIKWYPAWRHYCFFPEFETVHSDRCLREISEFITKLNDKKQRILKSRKSCMHGKICKMQTKCTKCKAWKPKEINGKKY